MVGLDHEVGGVYAAVHREKGQDPYITQFTGNDGEHVSSGVIIRGMQLVVGQSDEEPDRLVLVVDQVVDPMDKLRRHFAGPGRVFGKDIEEKAVYPD